MFVCYLLTIKTGSHIWGRKTTEVVLCPLGTYLEVAKVAAARLLHCKVAVFPFVIKTYLVGRSFNTR